jgi:regulator of sirC expression with transglutaminase-like and TPR domain
MEAGVARRALLDVAERDGDIAEGALWLAAEDCPGVEPSRWLERIDELGGELRGRCGLHGCEAADAPLVARLLHERLGLRGAGGGDPRSHYLHTVLERGAGMPIACSALWIAVGMRAAIPVVGVNAPGHFLVRVGDLIFDSTSGDEPLDDDAVRRLIAAATGDEPQRLHAEWLRTASTRDMLLRMSRNLRGLYVTLEDWPLALRAADRCVALAPGEASERRDRGLVMWRMGRPAAALEDLRAFVDATPEGSADHASAAELANRLRALLN